jgi:hypothetical protein
MHKSGKPALKGHNKAHCCLFRPFRAEVIAILRIPGRRFALPWVGLLRPLSATPLRSFALGFVAWDHCPERMYDVSDGTMVPSYEESSPTIVNGVALSGKTFCANNSQYADLTRLAEVSALETGKCSRPFLTSNQDKSLFHPASKRRAVLRQRRGSRGPGCLRWRARSEAFRQQGCTRARR